MKFRLSPRRLLVCSILLNGLLTMAPVAELKAQAISSEDANNAALQLMNEKKLPEAAAAFEDFLKKYPTSTVIPDAQYRLATLYYILGEYDKSRALIQKITQPPAPSDVMELGFGLLPQVSAAKATREKTAEARKAGFQSALREFDAFLQKYPSSSQMENIAYGRALTCFQLAKYDDAAETLRNNLKQFSKSETIQESQFLLAICRMAEGALLAQETPGGANAKAEAAFAESERLLKEIITQRRDIALLNDAQFQLGDLYVNQALFAPKEKRPALFAKGLEAYRSLVPREATIAAQDARIKKIRERRLAALTAKNIPLMKSLDGLLDHEITKLATVKAKGDLTISAQIKVGQLFYQKESYDEARLVFRQMQPFAQDEEQKKNLLYFLTLSYAQQSRFLPSEVRQRFVNRAVENYEAFQRDYKGDDLAENLPYTLGSLFVAKDPQKAITYYQEGIKLYPKGRLLNETLIAQANACIQLKQFDKALSTFQAFLRENPMRELAAAAELGIANILKETGKADQAIAQYQKITASYAGTPQAESAAFWIGQFHVQKGEIDAAFNDLTAFLKNFPKSELYPNAKYSLAQVYGRKGDPANALRVFKEVADEFPKAEAAPYAFFEQVALLAGPDKAADRTALMMEFLRRYPEHDKVFFAYNTIAQDLLAKKQTPEAIEVYNQMVEKHPADPQSALALFNIAALWTQQANNLGRYYALNEAQRTEWTQSIAKAIDAAERIVTDYPESPQVPQGLQYLAANQKLLAGAQLKNDDEVTAYFQKLAAKFGSKPQTRSKILFTLASYTYEQDKAKALAQMTAAYNPSLVYAAADIDLYGTALLEQGNISQAAAVYQKLAADFPNPDPAQPEKAPLQIQDAQSVALFGQAKALQAQGQILPAAEKYETYKRLYPNFAPAKLLEANYGIAVAAHQAKQDDKAIPLLIQVFRAPTASVELRANAMLLHAKIQEEKNELAPAIDQNLKIALFYDSVPAVAAEGLWRGGQLLEKQAATLPQTSQNPKEVTKPGQLRKALKAYKDLVAKYPTSPHASEAKARIAALEPALK